MTTAPRGRKRRAAGARSRRRHPGGVLTRRAPATAFEASLDNFTGPFDLLLGLISKHRLDITEIALARVTDDFIGHIRVEQAKPDGWDLSQATEFLLVAATLLDLKAAQLLPRPSRRTRRTSPSSRPGTSCSPGCCSTARSRTSRTPSSGWRRPAGCSRIPGAAPRGAVAGALAAVTPEQLAVIAARAMVPRRTRPSASRTCTPQPSRVRKRRKHHRCPAAPSSGWRRSAAS